MRGRSILARETVLSLSTPHLLLSFTCRLHSFLCVINIPRKEGQKHEISGLTSVLGFYSIKGKPTESSSVGQKTGCLFPSSHSL